MKSSICDVVDLKQRLAVPPVLPNPVSSYAWYIEPYRFEIFARTGAYRRALLGNSDDFCEIVTIKYIQDTSGGFHEIPNRLERL